MKLLFYISSLGGGGAERVMSTLVNAYADRGYDVTVATNIINTPVAYDIDKRVKFITLNEDSPKATGTIWNKIYLRKWKFSRYRNIAKSVNPDIAISFGTALNNDVIFSLLFSGIPIICSEHTNVAGKLYKRSTLFYRSIIYHFASAITVLTQSDYKLWKNKFHNVFYMPNPCDLQVSDIPKSRDKNVLAVGRVSQWHIKGFDNLIRIWSALYEKFPEWNLQIAGAYDEDSLAYLQSIIDEAKCKRVEFLGFRQDVKAIMEQSSVFCLSSRIEGLPMALIEAMNAGCCCVSFDVLTGPSEIIENGVSGLIAKNQDNEDLKEKLALVLKDAALRQELASRAPSSVQKYSTQNVLGMWDVLFSKIM